MLEVSCVINNEASYCCSVCGNYLFSDYDDDLHHEWEFCPFCGAPLYEQRPDDMKCRGGYQPPEKKGGFP